MRNPNSEKMVQLEDIIEVLQGLTKEGDTIYDLFFAEKRVIAAVVLHSSDLIEMYQKPNLLSLFIGSALESAEVKMRSTKLIKERRLAFKDKTLDEILSMHKASMEIDYENIVSVTIKKGLLKTSLEFEVQKHLKKKINFYLKRSQIAEVERVINRILPSKVLKTS